VVSGFRIEVLRTSFDWTDPGNPVHCVHSDYDFAFVQTDWSGMAEEARLQEDRRSRWRSDGLHFGEASVGKAWLS
jgi:hypothetical protein